MADKVCVVIQTYNEAHNITDSIESARLLTENIIVVDTQSTDPTIPLARSQGATIYEHPYTQYVEPVRNFAIEKGNADWVFLLDADERMTPELATEIINTIASTTHSYFKLPRKEYFARKQWLQHGGWWPNQIIRLIKKDAFIEWPAAIHSTPHIKGTGGLLKNAILHYSKNDYGVVVEKTTLFEDMESNLLFKANKPVNTPTFFRKFLGELYRRLFKKAGYKDGTIGIIESIYQAFSKTITYLYLYEKKQKSSSS